MVVYPCSEILCGYLKVIITKLLLKSRQNLTFTILASLPVFSASPRNAVDKTSVEEKHGCLFKILFNIRFTWHTSLCKS